nr:hypothetical protein [Tanacetum cinerariifolium]
MISTQQLMLVRMRVRCGKLLKGSNMDGESLESYYSRFYKMMNELIKNQCKVTNHQVNVQFLLQLQPEWKRFMTLVKQNQELKTVSYHKLYDILKQHQHEVNEIRAEKIARVANPLALVAQQQQQPVYHSQHHHNQFTQNSSTRSQQAATRNRGKAIVNSPQPIYDQEPPMVDEDDETETVGSTMVKKSRIQCYNCKEFGHVARECQKPKRVKDAAYHREKMLLYKQEEARIQLNAEQADWRDDTDDDELEDQELEPHYMYMAQLQQVSPDAADSGPIFDDEPLQKVSNDDHYNVFAMESTYPKQSESVLDTYPIEQDAQNKEAQIKLYKTREDKELKKVIELENKVKVLDNIVYETGQSVQMMNMLNNKCRTSFEKPEILKKAKRANPRLYDIGCYNDSLALMLAPESDEVIRLEKESRSKLSDLIRPYDYTKLNNLYDLFVPQREKSSEQRFFSERSKISHIHVQNEKKKESFQKRTTLLEKRMDESISVNKNCQSSLEIVNIKMNINTIITDMELCKQKIANRTYIGYIDPFIQNTI